MSIHYKLSALFAAVAFSSASFAEAADVKPERIRGAIVSFSGETLVVHRKSGDNATTPHTAKDAVRAVARSSFGTGAMVVPQFPHKSIEQLYPTIAL